MSNSLDDIPDGSKILVDTDIWLYLFTGNSPECIRLGARCNDGAIEAYVTSVIAGEFCHRAMLLEARQKGILSDNRTSHFLSSRSSLVRCLSEYRIPVLHWLQGSVTMVTTEEDDFMKALQIQENYGMMTNDSLNLAVMSRLGIEHLATANTTFNHLSQLSLYRPSDIVMDSGN